MKLPPLRIKLWMLPVLVALVGLGLGTCRWWRVRQEMLRMAAWHEWRAEVFAQSAKWIRSSEGKNWGGCKDQLDTVAKENRVRQRVGERLLRLDFPVPTAIREPRDGHQQEVETNLAVWHVWRDQMLPVCGDASSWHRQRANALRNQFFFTIAREREYDALHWKDESQRAFEIQDATFATLTAARARRSTNHRVASEELAILIDLARQPGSTLPAALLHDLLELQEVHSILGWTDQMRHLGEVSILMNFRQSAPTYRLPDDVAARLLPQRASRLPKPQTR